jgi:hypothetical protein
MTLAQLMCRLRRGHRWQTVEDEAGQVTQCARCGAIRHGGGGGRDESLEGKYEDWLDRWST